MSNLDKRAFSKLVLIIIQLLSLTVGIIMIFDGDMKGIIFTLLSSVIVLFIPIINTVWPVE